MSRLEELEREKLNERLRKQDYNNYFSPKNLKRHFDELRSDVFDIKKEVRDSVSHFHRVNSERKKELTELDNRLKKFENTLWDRFGSHAIFLLFICGIVYAISSCISLIDGSGQNGC